MLAGLASMLLLIPVNGFIASKMKSLQLEQMKNKDERAKLMNEASWALRALVAHPTRPLHHGFQDYPRKRHTR